MVPRMLRLRRLCALAAATTLVAGAELRAARPAADPIAVEIARFQERIRTTEPGDDEAKGAREFATPLLAQAARELGNGKRWFALQRLAFVWSNLEAADYRNTIPAASRTQMAALEQEFERFGPEVAAVTAGAARPSFDAAPAAARAIGEAAISELQGYYEASLDYGRNTAPEYGLYYVGAARAQLELARFAATIRDTAPAARPLAPRTVAREIDAVEDALLAAYRPPASVDSHAVFIRISALLKQAHELDAAGLHHGAIFKLLDAKMRLGRLLQPDRKLTSAEAGRRAWAAESQLAATGFDASLAKMFVEIALAQVADPDPASLGGETAAAVFDDVLPLYLTLLGPAPPGPPDRVAEATVTLVRWPYT